MVQYDTFSKCRIPTASVDTARQTPFSESRHIIVLRNGHVSSLMLCKAVVLLVRAWELEPWFQE